MFWLKLRQECGPEWLVLQTATGQLLRKGQVSSLLISRDNASFELPVAQLDTL
jgi:hypothetical protein